ncbi:MAG: MFS transporter [Pseudomonadota bacterium]
MTRTVDINPVIDQAAIRLIHIQVLAINILVALVDGFDNQALAFTAPAIAADWGISIVSFAPAFSSGLAGMMFGSLMFGEIADRLGRRFVFVWATALFGCVTLITPMAETVTQLLVLRFVAGLGLGGLPTVMASLVSEYAPKNRRATFGNWAFIGIPGGGFLGGLLASYLIPNFGWQSVYWLGGASALCVAAVAAFAMPESLAFLLRKKGDQGRARAILSKVAPEHVIERDSVLIAGPDETVKTSIVGVFRDGRAVMTVLFWISEIILLMGFYFLVNWIPSLLARSGLSMQTAVLGSAVLNIGGILFGLFIGRLCDGFGARRIVSATFLLGAASLFLATHAGGNVAILMSAIFLAGGAWIAGQSAIVVLIANNYPTTVRSIAVGWALTVGRIGAIASPAIVAVPLGWGWEAKDILLLPVLPAIVGSILVHFARPYGRRKDLPELAVTPGYR